MDPRPSSPENTPVPPATSKVPAILTAEGGAYTCGPVGCGPNAPFEELQQADATNQGDGFGCDPMCIAGNPDHRGGPNP